MTPWTTQARVESCPGCEQVDEVLVNSCILAASELLYHLSGERVHPPTERVVRPCCGQQANLRQQRLEDTDIYVLRGDTRDFAAQPCGYRERITLGYSPIIDVVEVLVDGQLVPGSAYRVDSQRYLIRTDGKLWPCCQNMERDAEFETDTFQVRFLYGGLPEMAVHAATTLACELAKACAGSPCNLPSRVTNITRQGVSAVLADPTIILSEGRTGLFAVDAFLAAVNPGNTRRKSGIASPDRPQRSVSSTSDFVS